jgi:hypothetical protein
LVVVLVTAMTLPGARGSAALSKQSNEKGLAASETSSSEDGDKDNI